MKGRYSMGWLMLALTALSCLYGMGANQKVARVADYCDLKGDGEYIGRVKSKNPYSGGDVITLLNDGSPNCPFTVLARAKDSNRVNVNDVLRFQATMSGPMLSNMRKLEINPTELSGVESRNINVEAWKIRETPIWGEGYRIMLGDGKQLFISNSLASKIKGDGCYRLGWNKSTNYVVGVGPCS